MGRRYLAHIPTHNFIFVQLSINDKILAKRNIVSFWSEMTTLATTSSMMMMMMITIIIKRGPIHYSAKSSAQLRLRYESSLAQSALQLARSPPGRYMEKLWLALVSLFGHLACPEELHRWPVFIIARATACSSRLSGWRHQIRPCFRSGLFCTLNLTGWLLKTCCCKLDSRGIIWAKKQPYL